MIEFDDSMKTLELDNFHVNVYLMRFQKLRKDFRFSEVHGATSMSDS